MSGGSKKRQNSETDTGSRAIDAFGSFVRKQISERTDILELAYSKDEQVRDRSDTDSTEENEEIPKSEVIFLNFEQNQRFFFSQKK